MSNMQDWYAPLEQEKPGRSGAEKGKKTAWKIAGGIALLLLLIVGSSMLFSGSDQQTTVPPAVSGGSMPDDWNEYFDNYYIQSADKKTEINLEKTEPVPGFKLNLSTDRNNELTLQELYDRCAKSTVAIIGYKDGVNGYYWGSGIILSEDGMILTNTHVIESCDSVSVTLYDNSSYEAKLVGADSISDIAVLKIEAAGLAPAEFGDSGSLNVGDKVAAIGNPLGETFRMTLTDGIISAIERGISYNGHSMTLLQTNTAINEGNSGGALFNMYGQVIGVTNMKMMSSYSSIEGIGFAIPSSTVATVVDSLVKYGEVIGRAAIGITVGPVPQNAMSYYSLPEGLYVSAVNENSDAAAKGIQKGDIITAVNGESVSTTNDILKVKNSLGVGDSISFTIWRDGDTFDIDVVLVDENSLD